MVHSPIPQKMEKELHDLNGSESLKSESSDNPMKYGGFPVICPTNPTTLTIYTLQSSHNIPMKYPNISYNHPIYIH